VLRERQQPHKMISVVLGWQVGKAEDSTREHRQRYREQNRAHDGCGGDRARREAADKGKPDREYREGDQVLHGPPCLLRAVE
jgi:hypothetical protein